MHKTQNSKSLALTKLKLPPLQKALKYNYSIKMRLIDLNNENIESMVVCRLSISKHTKN